jgi:hypothetical protein
LSFINNCKININIKKLNNHYIFIKLKDIITIFIYNQIAFKINLFNIKKTFTVKDINTIKKIYNLFQKKSS